MDTFWIVHRSMCESHLSPDGMWYPLVSINSSALHISFNNESTRWFYSKVSVRCRYISKHSVISINHVIQSSAADIAHCGNSTYVINHAAAAQFVNIYIKPCFSPNVNERAIISSYGTTIAVLLGNSGPCYRCIYLYTNYFDCIIHIDTLRSEENDQYLVEDTFKRILKFLHPGYFANKVDLIHILASHLYSTRP